MRNLKTTLILSATAFAAVASAQSFSGSVDTLANVTGGSSVCRTYANLLPGQTSTTMRLNNSGAGITAFGEAFAGPGLLATRRDVSSSGIPYGQSWGKATYRDAIKWTGPTPIKVRVCARLRGELLVDGSNPWQTDSGVSANFVFFADGALVNQTLQGGKTVEGTYDAMRGAIEDIYVTLQPGKWYTFTNTLQVNGDACDQSKPISSTYSRGDYTLKIWVEPTTLPTTGVLLSASGHDYSVKPKLPTGW